MGQRHQIYVKFPDKLGIAGFHHQWLYGMNAVSSLSRVLKFYLADDEYGPLKTNTGYGLKRQAEVINSLYSTCVETGYWHYIHSFLNEDDSEDVIHDPRLGDNNDGITIIDVSNGDFRYCFMNIDHLEGEVEPKSKLKPMSAREYLLCYYPKFFDKLGRVDWQKERETGEKVRYPIDDAEFDRALSDLLRIEENAKLLTLDECKKLFPKMYGIEPKSNIIELDAKPKTKKRGAK